MNTSIGHVEIFVKDPLKSRDFYTDILGFRLEEIQNDKFVWLSMNDRQVLLRPGENLNPVSSYQKSNMAVVIYTDDMKGTMDTYISRGLEIKGDDTRCPVFTDPDGNWFQLVNPNKH